MPNENGTIDQFISQKRQQGQNDSMILDELVAGGWDRTSALKALGGAIPTPAAGSMAVFPQTSQTGSLQSPVQVENLQYNMKIGKVRSKAGLAMLLVAILAWALAFVALLLLLSLSSAIFPNGVLADTSYQDNIITSVAILVPVLPLWLYCLKRLNKILGENVANLDDVFFKRTVRFNLVLWLLVTVGWAIVTVFNVLDKVIKNDPSMTPDNIFNSFIFTGVFAALTYLFFHYQLKTRR